MVALSCIRASCTPRGCKRTPWQAAGMLREHVPRLRVERINAWRALQGAAAATLAWALAKQLGGDHDPFFAPISAFIALNAPFGERGRNAVRLLIGVFAGIAVGEATVALLGGYGGVGGGAVSPAGLSAAPRGGPPPGAPGAPSAVPVVPGADQ